MRNAVYSFLGFYIACAFFDALTTMSLNGMGLIEEGNAVPRFLMSVYPSLIFLLPVFESLVMTGVTLLVRSDKDALTITACLASVRVLVLIHNLSVFSVEMGRVLQMAGR